MEKKMEPKVSHSFAKSTRFVLGLPEIEAYDDDTIVNAIVKKDGHQVPDEQATGSLYSITTVARSARYGGTRTVALCRSFDRAKEIVETNEGDIWEHSYMLVVIEEIVPDTLYGGDARGSWWYRWHLDRECYEAIEVPDPYKNIVGFGVG